MKPNSRLAIFVLLLIIGVSLAIISYISHDSSSVIIGFLAHQHVALMLLVVLISIGFGYSWSAALQVKLSQEKQTSKELRMLISQLLGPEDQLVLELLLESNGRISQSKISRHEKMTRVKAHRTVKSLEDRGVITTEKIGKQVYLTLHQSVLDSLK